jgi:hypothetical protein
MLAPRQTKTSRDVGPAACDLATSYYEAAQGEIANLGPDVRWDCVLKYRDSEQE